MHSLAFWLGAFIGIQLAGSILHKEHSETYIRILYPVHYFTFKHIRYGCIQMHSCGREHSAHGAFKSIHLVHSLAF